MTQKLNENDYFKTSDLSLCATLGCLGYCVEATDKENPQKIKFLIRRDEYLDQLIQLFWAHGLTVDPLIYFNTLKELKSRVYAD
jgi:hypothetical protein